MTPVTEDEAQRLAYALAAAVVHGTPEIYDLLMEAVSKPLAVLHLVATLASVLDEPTATRTERIRMAEVLEHQGAAVSGAQLAFALRASMLADAEPQGRVERLQVLALAAARLQDLA